MDAEAARGVVVAALRQEPGLTVGTFMGQWARWEEWTKTSVYVAVVPDGERWRTWLTRYYYPTNQLHRSVQTQIHEDAGLATLDDVVRSVVQALRAAREVEE